MALEGKYLGFGVLLLLGGLLLILAFVVYPEYMIYRYIYPSILQTI
jgi:hypothetical protein